MSVYWETFIRGVLQSPLLYVQGFIVLFFVTPSRKGLSLNLSLREFFQVFCFLSLFQFILLGSVAKQVKYHPSLSPYMFILYVLVFCLLYEVSLFIFRRMRKQDKWDPVSFTLLFLSVGGVFCTAEILDSSMKDSLIFILGQILGIGIFLRILVVMYMRYTQIYYGPRILQNPLMIVFLSFFIAGVLSLFNI